MARRKNVKRIDPRYFLHETVNRGEELEEEQGIFAPNHYCVHHGGVQYEGQIKMAEAINHNFDRKLNRVTHYDMRLQDGTILEGVPAEDIQIVRASLAEEHSHGCPSEEEGATHISQLTPEEAFDAGLAAAKDAIDQAMGAPDGPAPEGGPLHESWALAGKALMMLLGSESGRKMLTSVLDMFYKVTGFLSSADDVVLDKVFGLHTPEFLNKFQDLAMGRTQIKMLSDFVSGMSDEDAQVLNTAAKASMGSSPTPPPAPPEE
jgi:hypothetical protein